MAKKSKKSKKSKKTNNDDVVENADKNNNDNENNHVDPNKAINENDEKEEDDMKSDDRDNEKEENEESDGVERQEEDASRSKKRKSFENDNDPSNNDDDNDDDDDSSNNDDDDDDAADLEGKPNFYSSSKDDTFTSLPLSPRTLTALSTLSFTRMTEIQSKSIPALLSGKDLVGCAKTGSGKTLAFLIPVIELLHKAKFTNRNGTGAIVITPTRELALQIYGVLHELCTASKHNQTHGLIMGGANRSTEAHKLLKGVNIVVATPGRLLDHLLNTKGFVFRNLLALVIDEADRILDIGFEEDLRTIIKTLPKERQTMLFSATQTQKVEQLATVSINESAIYVDIPSQTKLSTVAGLEQGYVTCPSSHRFLLLFTFLKKNKSKKIMVFFSSCNSVKFHSELLNYIDIPVSDIHGRQKQQKRTTTFFQFCNDTSGTLLCTDVAARGLDIPDVDWIVQFDPPDDPKEYIHRVGRTARGATGKGRALLFLTPEETGFLRYLKEAKVALNEYEFPIKKLANVQSQLQKIIEKNYYLNRSARDAYRSYLLAYGSHSLKDIFNVHELDLQAVGLAFGFTTPPRVDLDFRVKSRKQKFVKDGKSQKKRRFMTGHGFSAENPYGKKNENDKRQFSY